MKIEIWSDVVCPWCYVGSRNLQLALARFGRADDVEIEWKAYELDPHAPIERPDTYIERSIAKFGMSADEARGRLAKMVRVGADAGIDFRFEDARPGNTFEAHRLLHLARTIGLQNELADRLFAATFTEGYPIGDRETLVKLAGDVGIPEAATRRVLDGQEFAAEVRADVVEAREIGVQGVPFFVFDRRYAVSGAQPPAVLLDVLERAWRAHPIEIVGDADGRVCEGDTCEL